MSLVQVSKRMGTIERVRRDAPPPIVELFLEPNERVVSMDLQPVMLFHREGRKTVDWRWVAYVEHRL